MNIKDKRKLVFGLCAVAVLAVVLIVCFSSKCSNTPPEIIETPEQLYKSITLNIDNTGDEAVKELKNNANSYKSIDDLKYQTKTWIDYIKQMTNTIKNDMLLNLGKDKYSDDELDEAGIFGMSGSEIIALRDQYTQTLDSKCSEHIDKVIKEFERIAKQKGYSNVDAAVNELRQY